MYNVEEKKYAPGLYFRSSNAQRLNATVAFSAMYRIIKNAEERDNADKKVLKRKQTWLGE